jgi:plastocyanin
VRIHVGDKVRFVPNGFHTVDLPGQRSRKLPLITPVVQTISGSVDAAGAPFWFKRAAAARLQPPAADVRLRQGPQLRRIEGRAQRPAARAAAEADDRQVQQDRDIPLLLRRPSRHEGDRPRRVLELECPLGRGGQANGAPPRSRRRWRPRRTLAKHSGTREQHGRRRAEGKGNVSFFGFIPSTLTVPAGTTVTFRMNASTEIHTATVGPGNPENEPQSYLGQIEAGLQGAVLDPRGVLPSDQPPTVAR